METERVILTYLQCKGYRYTEQSLKNDIKNIVKQDITELAFLPQCDSTMSALFKSIFDTNIDEVYVNTFSVFYKWVESSLDMCRGNLRKLLEPLLTHFYLQLIKRDMLETAQQMLEDYSKVLSSPNTAKSLASIKSLSQFDQPLVKSTLESKFLIEMDNYSFSLVKNFVEEENLDLILYVLNNHVDVSFSQEAPEITLLGHEIEIQNRNDPLELDHKVLVPYPEINPSILKDKDTDLTNADPVSSQNLPNISAYTFLYSSNTVLCIATNEEADLVAAGFEDSTVRLWDFLNPVQKYQNVCTRKESYKEYKEFIGHSGGVFSVSISPDNKLLLSGSEDKQIRLWLVATSSCLVVYSFHSYPVWSVNFGRKGYYFASGSGDKTVCVWCTQKAFPLRVMVGHVSDVVLAKFHPNLLYLFSSSYDKTVRMWGVNSGECFRLFLRSSLVTDLTINKELLILGEESGTVEALSLESKETAWRLNLEGPIASLASSNHLLALGMENSQVYLVSDQGELVSCYYTKETPVTFATFTLRNLLVVAGSYLGTN